MIKKIINPNIYWLINWLKVSAGDEIYKYDREQQQSLLAAKPWEKDPHFFKEYENILRTVLVCKFVCKFVTILNPLTDLHQILIWGSRWSRQSWIPKLVLYLISKYFMNILMIIDIIFRAKSLNCKLWMLLKRNEKWIYEIWKYNNIEYKSGY